MSTPAGTHLYRTLSRRERQIMDLVYRLGEADVAAVEEGLARPPSNAAVRRMLSILEEKGWLAHRKEGRKFVYRPTVKPEAVGRSNLNQLISTFFEGSLARAFVAQLNTPSAELSMDELDELAELVEAERERRRALEEGAPSGPRRTGTREPAGRPREGT